MSIDNPAASITVPVSVAQGGTAATTTSGALASMGISTPIGIGSGGTASTTTSGALTALGIAGSTVGMQKIVLSGVSSATSTTLPANAYIDQIFVKNNTANAVTGGLKFGTSSGGADVVVALPVAASVITVPAALILTKFGAAQQIFIDAVAAWNSANVDITIVYGQF